MLDEIYARKMLLEGYARHKGIYLFKVSRSKERKRVPRQVTKDAQKFFPAEGSRHRLGY